jgi:hypothetical protein
MVDTQDSALWSAHRREWRESTHRPQRKRSENIQAEPSGPSPPSTYRPLYRRQTPRAVASSASLPPTLRVSARMHMCHPPCCHHRHKVATCVSAFRLQTRSVPVAVVVRGLTTHSMGDPWMGTSSRSTSSLNRPLEGNSYVWS